MVAHNRKTLLAAVLVLSPLGLAASDGHRKGSSKEIEVRAKSAFRVNPMKIRLKGRPGQVLPFSIEVVNGQEGPQTLALQVVDFVQEPTGAVLPGEDVVASGFVSLNPGMERLHLRAGESTTVRGTAVVHATSPPFRTLGVLVSNAPEKEAPDVPTAPEKTSLAVQYVTRYLVRVELDVPAAPALRVKELELTDGNLIDRDGRAVARFWVENETDQAFELRARCQMFLADRNVAVGAPFELVQPVNSRRPERTRGLGKVLPGSRVAHEALVPEPLAPGKYVMRTRVQSGREKVHVDFACRVDVGDFPAQAVVLPRIVGSTLISPPTIQLSSRRRGARIVPVRLENRGAVGVRIMIAPDRDTRGLPIDWLVVRPTFLKLDPSRQRRVAVTFRTRGKLRNSRYGFLRFAVEPEDGSLGGSHRIPVALLGPETETPRLKLGPLERLETPRGLAFRISVKNDGAAHAALHGGLAVLDPFGRRLEEVPAGFGQWLMPQEEQSLTFRLKRGLQAGQYRLEARVRPAEDGDPVTKDLVWHQEVAGVSPADPRRNK